ncbi:MAG: non-hydrolyzing UDP-N-acetylglucosamine 2-epimerase [Fluviibacter phosphoraccumulans]
MITIATIIGARPQFIKAAVVSRAFREHRPDIREVLIHTGQHFDTNMSDVFFEELDISRPDHHLGIGGGTHGQNTGRMIEAIEAVLINEKPDWVLVYGDTDSTLAGALAAAKLHIPVAHVEAGLRSFNRRMPEEINRVLTDHIATKLMAPTKLAMRNLRAEGLPEDRLVLVGDVMHDASLFYRDRAKRPDWFGDISVDESNFILATVHRAENTDEPKRLAGIITGLSQGGRPVILPLHPRTRARLTEYGIAQLPHLHFVDPVGYLEMVWLEAHCSVVATDSGGVQKEAYFFRKPCVTLRDETEWVELVESGWNTIAGIDANRIAAALSDKVNYGVEGCFYGDGDAAKRVIKAIL